VRIDFWVIHLPSKSGCTVKVVFVEFEAVAPGIFCVETADLWERGVVCDFDAASEQGVTQFVEVSGNEGGMGFLGGAEIVLDADVELLGAAFEPAAASCAERLRFFNFSHAEKSAIEIAGGGFTAFGSGNLDVIESRDSKLHI